LREYQDEAETYQHRHGTLQSNEYEKAAKSTKAIDILPLITVWLQVASWQTTNEVNSPSAIVCGPEEPSPPAFKK